MSMHAAAFRIGEAIPKKASRTTRIVIACAGAFEARVAAAASAPIRMPAVPGTFIDSPPKSALSRNAISLRLAPLAAEAEVAIGDAEVSRALSHFLRRILSPARAALYASDPVPRRAACSRVMPCDSVVKARDVIKLLTANGWNLDRIAGSHRIFKKAGNPRIIALPIHKMGDDVPNGLLKQIMKDADLK